MASLLESKASNFEGLLPALEREAKVVAVYSATATNPWPGAPEMDRGGAGYSARVDSVADPGESGLPGFGSSPTSRICSRRKRSPRSRTDRHGCPGRANRCASARRRNILDFRHAAEYLAGALKLLQPDKDARKAREAAGRQGAPAAYCPSNAAS